MSERQPVALSPDEIAAVRSWVIHEDAHVIAFSKPPGLSSQGGRIKAHTLDDLLWAFDENAYIPHQIAGTDDEDELTPVLIASLAWGEISRARAARAKLPLSATATKVFRRCRWSMFILPSAGILNCYQRDFISCWAIPKLTALSWRHS